MSISDGSSTDAVRVFAVVKVDLPASLERVLIRLGNMGRAVRPVRGDDLHVTLKFFGDVERPSIAAIAEGLDGIARTRDAFDWKLIGTGAFPTPARPSVIWAGAEDGSRLADLAEAVESFAESLNFSREARRFHPHVTLARIRFRPPVELAALLKSTADTEFGVQHATEITLFRSTLGPSGSTYTPLHAAKLGGGEVSFPPAG